MSFVQEYGRLAETLLKHVETGTTDQAEAPLTVPATMYTDPEQWAKEMDLIYKRLPLMLAMSAEIPNPGDYKAMDIMGLPLLLTRSKDGKINAFLNVCTHRAMAVVADGKGNCNKFSCPYHGWTYANDGRLIGVADRQKFGEFPTASRNLTALPCDERAGMIFIILTPGIEMDLESFLGGMLPDLEAVGFADWHYCGSRDIYGANWKITYDGYLEGYHFAVAHPETIHKRTYSNIMEYDFFGPHMRIGFAQQGIAKLHDVPREEWGTHENDGYDFVRVLFPNISIFVAPEITQIAHLLPGPTPDKNRTILSYVTRHHPTTDEERAQNETMMNFLQDVTYREDYLLGETVQKGLNSGALKNVVFGKNERGNQHFHKWVDYYVQNDPTAQKPSV